MRKPRIFTSQSLLSNGSVELTGSTSHYLTRVLRLSEGDCVVLFNGDGRDYSAEIIEARSQCVQVRVFENKLPGNESPLKITLVQAIGRGERMDYALQKATELGVYCIQPLISHRVGVRLDASRQAKRLKHWQGVVVSACEQSGRAFVPEVKTPLSLADWLAETDQSQRLVLEPFAKHKLMDISIAGDALDLLVGPEGGFTDDEIEAARANDVRAVSLGPRVLRTETAGPAAIAVLQAKTGGF
jgi:16S rRNA (uracil1498-N3)-methyltransferase